MKKNYTVIGSYGDNSQPWMAHVANSTSPRAAAKRGIRDIYAKGENGVELEDIFVVEVIEGYVMGTLGNDAVLDIKDLEGK